MKIKTRYGEKHIIKQVGIYYCEIPASNAPHGGWWKLNQERDFVPIPSNSPALLAALKSEGR